MLTNLLGFELMWRGLCPRHINSMRKSYNYKTQKAVAHTARAPQLLTLA